MKSGERHGRASGERDEKEVYVFGTGERDGGKESER